MTIVVDLVQGTDKRWWWRAKDCKLVRGPFADRVEADSDASEVAPDLIAALVACEAATSK